MRSGPKTAAGNGVVDAFALVVVGVVLPGPPPSLPRAAVVLVVAPPE